MKLPFTTKNSDMIDSFYELLENSKAEYTNEETPFIRKTAGGKLIIDMEDLKCLSQDERKYKIIKVLNDLATLTTNTSQ